MIKCIKNIISNFKKKKELKKQIDKDLSEYFETEIRNSKKIDENVFNNGGRD